MSGRLTLSDLLPDVSEALNLTKSGQRAIRYINQAQEELLPKGRWVGTLIRYRICSQSPVITWPRQLGTIEAMSQNGFPVDLHNQWYDFMDYGPREMYRDSWWYGNSRWSMTSGDLPESISFAEVNPAGNPKKLKVYASATEDASARILLQFYDQSGNYVRSDDATEGWVDGEFVSINATTPQTTINAVSSWVGVQKPCTNGTIRVVELDTVTNLERTLAIYEHDETSPSYRRSKIPSPLCNPSWQVGLNNTSNTPCVLTVIGKQRLVKATQPRDYLALQSKAAIIEMCRSIYKRENNLPQEAPIYEQKAVNLLDEQLLEWIGSGAQTVPQFDMAFGYGSGPQFVI